MWAASPASAQQPAVVGTDKVTAEAVDQTAPTIGRFVTLFEAVVPALLASHVTEIPVNIGDRLAVGDIIAVLRYRPSALAGPAGESERRSE